MSKKKRSFEPKALHEVLHQITSERNLAKGLNELKVKEAWATTMGPHVQQFTQQITLKGKIVHVQLSSAPLREELSYGKEKILKHLNDTLGFEGIQKIIFR